ncbi:unnamed protein product [Spirodela intermedia]|uniref:TF-B3 domain-containing protein n=1 Tax=Spirodela intermedia TaxID=51605 RepID=A0A7I8LM88_SPIIN|nr:unnamed protein product [Spirodela intermedia]
MLRKHTYQDELLQSKRAIALTSSAELGSTACLFRSDRPTAAAREKLFDKALTPSDVGKLNRLVIPKQHAEKHFPLQVNGPACKGTLVNFEDPCGKVWRFRYSYWNSSQSYVLTKGWSRFVKEKALKAGDLVGFHRSTGPERHLFIDMKPRVTATVPGVLPVQADSRPLQVMRLFGVNIVNVSTGGHREVDESSAGKRLLEIKFLPPAQLCKRQCLGALCV